MITPSPIPSLHAAYVRLTGRDLTCDYLKTQFWWVWLRYRKDDPFTERDLEQVVAYLKFKIRKGERRPECLKFTNLIQSPDWFEEDRADARAHFRKPKPNPAKASVLAATGRAEPQPQSSPEQVKSIVERTLKQLREEVK